MSTQLENTEHEPHLSASSTVNNSTASSVMDLSTEEKADVEKEPAQERKIRGWRWFLVSFAIYVTAFLYGLDTTIAADVQPDIVKSLGSIEKLAWIGTGFPLGSVAIILPLGYAYGLFEIKTLYIGSIILFEVGSAICGAAPTMDVLIIGRIIAGAGGAGIYLGILNYIGVFTTMKEQNFYNSLCAMIWGLGTVLGPVIGGGFAISSATWRWAFYINLVIAGVLAPIFVFYLPTNRPKPAESVSSKLLHMDWLGILLIAATYTTYTLALTFGGAQWPWNDYRYIIMIVFFVVILLAFIGTQYFALFTTYERRLFPGHFLKSLDLILVFVTMAATTTSLFVATYYIPLFFQFAKSDTAIMAAVRLLPFMISNMVFVMLNGTFMPKFGYYMPWYVFSGAFILIGGSLMYTINLNTSPSNIYGYSVLLGIGCGATLQSGYAIAASKVKASDIPAAIGYVNIAQIGTIVIALTIAGTVFQNLAFKNLTQALSAFDFSEADIRNAISGAQSAVFQNGSEEVKTLALDAIITTMDSVFILVITAGAVILVSSVFLKREKLFMVAVAGA